MSTPVGGRAQRADARANRGRILDVAEQVFGRDGEAGRASPVAHRTGRQSRI
jgi:hypothetical protein